MIELIDLECGLKLTSLVVECDQSTDAGLLALQTDRGSSNNTHKKKERTTTSVRESIKYKTYYIVYK